MTSANFEVPRAETDRTICEWRRRRERHCQRQFCLEIEKGTYAPSHCALGTMAVSSGSHLRSLSLSL